MDEPALFALGGSTSSRQAVAAADLDEDRGDAGKTRGGGWDLLCAAWPGALGSVIVFAGFEAWPALVTATRVGLAAHSEIAPRIARACGLARPDALVPLLRVKRGCPPSRVTIWRAARAPSPGTKPQRDDERPSCALLRDGGDDGANDGDDDGVGSMPPPPPRIWAEKGARRGPHDVELRCARSGARLCRLAGHTAPVRSVRLLASDEADPTARVATAGDDATVRLWALADGQCCALLQPHDAPVTHLRWGSRARLLFSGGADGRVVLCDGCELPARPLNTAAGGDGEDDDALTLPLHRGAVTTMALANVDEVALFSGGDDGRVVAMGADGTVLGELAARAPTWCARHAAAKPRTSAVRTIETVRARRALVVLHDGGTTAVWRFGDGDAGATIAGAVRVSQLEEATWAVDPRAARSYRESPWVRAAHAWRVGDGSSAACVAIRREDDQLTVWAPRHGMKRFVHGRGQPLTASALAPGGLIVGSDISGRLLFWDFRDGEPVMVEPVNEVDVRVVAAVGGLEAGAWWRGGITDIAAGEDRKTGEISVAVASARGVAILTWGC